MDKDEFCEDNIREPKCYYTEQDYFDYLKKRRIDYTDYKGLMPKIRYMYSGYKGLQNGVCLLWKGYMVILIRPINER